jgi:hypothetical protein
MSITNNETGEVYCASHPTYGGGNPVLPHARDQTKFQEKGFIAVPPCLWGSAAQGLDAPPSLNIVYGVRVLSAPPPPPHLHADYTVTFINMVCCAFFVLWGSSVLRFMSEFSLCVR